MFTAYINNPDGFVDLAFVEKSASGFTKGEAVQELAFNLPEGLPYPVTSVTIVNGDTFIAETYDLDAA